jgi:hypothetical protein
LKIVKGAAAKGKEFVFLNPENVVNIFSLIFSDAGKSPKKNEGTKNNKIDYSRSVV